jgi:hypothetical protein
MFLIERIDMRAYFSIKVGRNFGSQYGWTQDTSEALQFCRKIDADLFQKTYLANEANHCRIAEK